MLPREQRLRHAEDFERLRRDGRAVHGRLLTLSSARNDLPLNRYGFVVSKRVGNAVVRNRTRRLFREAVRAIDAECEQGFDIVLIARPAVQGQPLSVVAEALGELVMRAGLSMGSGKRSP